MIHRQWLVCPIVFMLIGVASRQASAYWPDTIARGVLKRWAAHSAQTGRVLLDKYGLPDDVTPVRMTWNNKGPWKRTIVSNRKQIYRSLADFNILEQTVDYKVPFGEAAELLAFREGLVVDLDDNELSSRADREEVNVLTLNLVDDMLHGRKTMAQARQSFDEIIALEAAGKSSPYLTRLLWKDTAP